MPEKPVAEVTITSVDLVALEPGDTGALMILFATTSPQELAVRMSPIVVSMLETKLQEARETLARRRSAQ